MRHPSLGWRILFSGFNHLNTKMTAIRTHIIIEFMRADKNTGERFNLVVLAKKSSAAAKCCDGQDARCRISNSETTARLISKHSCERSSTGIGLNQLIQDHVPGHDFSLTPKPDDGPVTVTWELTRCGKGSDRWPDNLQTLGLPMPFAKIHFLEGQYSEARLDKVSNAIQEALVGHRHGGCDFHAPAGRAATKPPSFGMRPRAS